MHHRAKSEETKVATRLVWLPSCEAAIRLQYGLRAWGSASQVVRSQLTLRGDHYLSLNRHIQCHTV
jgi:hypothetical protein